MPPAAAHLARLARPSTFPAAFPAARSLGAHATAPPRRTYLLPAARASFHSVPARRSGDPPAATETPPAAAGLPELEFVRVTFPAPGVGQSASLPPAARPRR
jgi:hypothetical protein